jgi:hypothetical protein
VGFSSGPAYSTHTMEISANSLPGNIRCWKPAVTVTQSVIWPISPNPPRLRSFRKREGAAAPFQHERRRPPWGLTDADLSGRWGTYKQWSKAVLLLVYCSLSTPACADPIEEASPSPPGRPEQRPIPGRLHFTSTERAAVLLATWSLLKKRGSISSFLE